MPDVPPWRQLAWRSSKVKLKWISSLSSLEAQLDQWMTYKQKTINGRNFKRDRGWDYRHQWECIKIIATWDYETRKVPTESCTSWKEHENRVINAVKE